jgi:hypothetical protein
MPRALSTAKGHAAIFFQKPFRLSSVCPPRAHGPFRVEVSRSDGSGCYNLPLHPLHEGDKIRKALQRGTKKEVTRQGNLPYVLRWRRWRGAPEVVVIRYPLFSALYDQ